uniref:Uncharacterized protein n=1 Tax=Amphilophus citrinellus TaxID=61819 RepID=A0A3Q0S299_AMPCI
NEGSPPPQKKRSIENSPFCISLMNCPPTKRLRGLNQDVVTAVAFDDPFGDDEEFTQDVLDEIDIIASQAITSGSSACLGAWFYTPVAVEIIGTSDLSDMNG